MQAENNLEVSRESMILNHVDVEQMKNVCEIGVLNGGFSEWLLNNLNPENLFLVDPWLNYDSYNDSNNSPQDEQDKRFSDVLKKFSGTQGVEVVREKSEVFLPKFEDEFFDLIYIDGDHRFTGVLSDLILSANRVKRGGFIVIDDLHLNENGSSPWPEIMMAFSAFLQFYINMGGSGSIPKFEFVDWCSNNIIIRRLG